MFKRWHVVITYNSAAVPPVVIDVEELEDIQTLVEAGPDWRFIKKIVVTYNA